MQVHTSDGNCVLIVALGALPELLFEVLPSSPEACRPLLGMFVSDLMANFVAT